jgi:hypothetical protein
MLRPFGPGLPSDCIVHRYGFDGNEPDDEYAFYLAHLSCGVRSTFAINTFYEEIEGGYYNNRSLYALINRAMNAIGLFAIQSDYWRENGVVPVESEGHLEELETYILAVEPASKVGIMKISACVAGGGPYYKDNIIFDIILPAEHTRRLVDEVEARCQAAAVRFTRAPDQAPTPTKPPAGVWNWIRSRLH